MNLFDDAMNGLIRNAKVKVNECDYEKNGLVYCGVCKEPKQCRINMANGIMTVACMCKCDVEKERQAEEEFQSRKKASRIRRMRANGVIDKSLSACLFESANMTENLQKCKNYADNWDKMKEKGTGLVLWGGVGTGKTFAAACIVNQLISNGVPAMITSFPKILNGQGYNKLDVVEHMNEFDLVVIDDLGVERTSDFALETVYMVIDERYKSMKPFIVTTNLHFEKLENPDNIMQKRIYDRIMERCVPISFTGKSLRKITAGKRTNEISNIILGKEAEPNDRG